jgi:hypothetical protein
MSLGSKDCWRLSGEVWGGAANESERGEDEASWLMEWKFKFAATASMCASLGDAVGVTEVGVSPHNGEAASDLSCSFGPRST